MSRKKRLLKTSSAEYKEVAAGLAFYGMPTFDEWMFDIRKQWDEQFANSEKIAPDGNPGPITFSQYMQEVRSTLRWRREQDIPERYGRGLLTKRDYVENIEFVKKLEEYAARAARELERETTS